MIYLLLLICTNQSGHNTNITVETYAYKKPNSCSKVRENNINNIKNKCEKYTFICQVKDLEDKK